MNITFQNYKEFWNIFSPVFPKLCLEDHLKYRVTETFNTTSIFWKFTLILGTEWAQNLEFFRSSFLISSWEVVISSFFRREISFIMPHRQLMADPEQKVQISWLLAVLCVLLTQDHLRTLLVGVLFTKNY